jgi:Ca2+-binding EF-hand superfamily protein
MSNNDDFKADVSEYQLVFKVFDKQNEGTIKINQVNDLIQSFDKRESNNLDIDDRNREEGNSTPSNDANLSTNIKSKNSSLEKKSLSNNLSKYSKKQSK